MFKKGVLNILVEISEQFWLESGQICTHVCFIANSNTCQVPREMFEHSDYSSLVFKQLPQNLANVNI